MIQIKNLKENDEYFNATFAKFCNSSLDSKALSDLIKYIQKKLDLSNLSLPAANQDNSYLDDCLYAFASYIISRGNLIKTKKKMPDISIDINKGVLSKE
jgi:hypothetical protein